jgi:lipopolysaccharide export system protein LptA
MTNLHRSHKFLVATMALFFSCAASAEKADREQPIDLEADSVTVNDAKKTSTYVGNVILTQGTLVIHADKLIVREDNNGFQHSTSFGNPTTFKQKQEGNASNMTATWTRCSCTPRPG